MINLINKSSIKRILTITFLILGAVATYLLRLEFNLSAVIASSIVGLFAGILLLIFKDNSDLKYAEATYCGSFVGMSSLLYFNNFPILFIASILAGIIFIGTENVFKGFGGKLGTIAFLGVFPVLFLLRKNEVFDNQSIESMLALENIEYLIVLVISFVGVASTFILSQSLKVNSVFSSAFLSLVFALFSTIIFKQSNLYDLAPVVFMGASFAGMSSDKVFLRKRDVVISGTFFFLIYIFLDNVACGFGGKLGLIAFLAVGINSIVFKPFPPRKKVE